MVPTRPTELHQRRLRLAREPTAAAEARGQVRAVIRDWQVPVDPDIAVLLTSDMMAHAITHGAAVYFTLAFQPPDLPGSAIVRPQGTHVETVSREPV